MPRSASCGRSALEYILGHSPGDCISHEKLLYYELSKCDKYLLENEKKEENKSNEANHKLSYNNSKRQFSWSWCLLKKLRSVRGRKTGVNSNIGLTELQNNQRQPKNRIKWQQRRDREPQIEKYDQVGRLQSNGQYCEGQQLGVQQPQRLGVMRTWQESEKQQRESHHLQGFGQQESQLMMRQSPDIASHYSKQAIHTSEADAWRRRQPLEQAVSCCVEPLLRTRTRYRKHRQSLHDSNGYPRYKRKMAARRVKQAVEAGASLPATDARSHVQMQAEGKGSDRMTLIAAPATTPMARLWVAAATEPIIPPAEFKTSSESTQPPASRTSTVPADLKTSSVSTEPVAYEATETHSPHEILESSKASSLSAASTLNSESGPLSDSSLSDSSAGADREAPSHVPANTRAYWFFRNRRTLGVQTARQGRAPGTGATLVRAGHTLGGGRVCVETYDDNQPPPPCPHPIITLVAGTGHCFSALQKKLFSQKNLRVKENIKTQFTQTDDKDAEVKSVLPFVTGQFRVLISEEIDQKKQGEISSLDVPPAPAERRPLLSPDLPAPAERRPLLSPDSPPPSCYCERNSKSPSCLLNVDAALSTSELGHPNKNTIKKKKIPKWKRYINCFHKDKPMCTCLSKRNHGLRCLFCKKKSCKCTGKSECSVCKQTHKQDPFRDPNFVQLLEDEVNFRNALSNKVRIFRGTNTNIRGFESDKLPPLPSTHISFPHRCQWRQRKATKHPTRKCSYCENLGGKTLKPLQDNIPCICKSVSPLTLKAPSDSRSTTTNESKPCAWKYKTEDGNICTACYKPVCRCKCKAGKKNHLTKTNEKKIDNIKKSQSQDNVHLSNADDEVQNDKMFQDSQKPPHPKKGARHVVDHASSPMSTDESRNINQDTMGKSPSTYDHQQDVDSQNGKIPVNKNLRSDISTNTNNDTSSLTKSHDEKFELNPLQSLNKEQGTCCRTIFKNIKDQSTIYPCQDKGNEISYKDKCCRVGKLAEIKASDKIQSKNYKSQKESSRYNVKNDDIIKSPKYLYEGKCCRLGKQTLNNASDKSQSKYIKKKSDHNNVKNINSIESLKSKDNKSGQQHNRVIGTEKKQTKKGSRGKPPKTTSKSIKDKHLRGTKRSPSQYSTEETVDKVQLTIEQDNSGGVKNKSIKPLSSSHTKKTNIICQCDDKDLNDINKSSSNALTGTYSTPLTKQKQIESVNRETLLKLPTKQCCELTGNNVLNQNNMGKDTFCKPQSKENKEYYLDNARSTKKSIPDSYSTDKAIETPFSTRIKDSHLTRDKHKDKIVRDQPIQSLPPSVKVENNIPDRKLKQAEAEKYTPAIDKAVTSSQFKNNINIRHDVTKTKMGTLHKNEVNESFTNKMDDVFNRPVQDKNNYAVASTSICDKNSELNRRHHETITKIPSMNQPLTNKTINDTSYVDKAVTTSLINKKNEHFSKDKILHDKTTQTEPMLPNFINGGIIAKDNKVSIPQSKNITERHHNISGNKTKQNNNDSNLKIKHLAQVTGRSVNVKDDNSSIFNKAQYNDKKTDKYFRKQDSMKAKCKAVINNKHKDQCIATKKNTINTNVTKESIGFTTTPISDKQEKDSSKNELMQLSPEICANRFPVTSKEKPIFDSIDITHRSFDKLLSERFPNKCSNQCIPKLPNADSGAAIAKSDITKHNDNNKEIKYSKQYSLKNPSTKQDIISTSENNKPVYMDKILERRIKDSNALSNKKETSASKDQNYEKEINQQGQKNKQFITSKYNTDIEKNRMYPKHEEEEYFNIESVKNKRIPYDTATLGHNNHNLPIDNTIIKKISTQKGNMSYNRSAITSLNKEEKDILQKPETNDKSFNTSLSKSDIDTKNIKTNRPSAAGLTLNKLGIMQDASTNTIPSDFDKNQRIRCLLDCGCDININEKLSQDILQNDKIQDSIKLKNKEIRLLDEIKMKTSPFTNKEGIKDPGFSSCSTKNSTVNFCNDLIVIKEPSKERDHSKHSSIKYSIPSKVYQFDYFDEMSLDKVQIENNRGLQNNIIANSSPPLIKVDENDIDTSSLCSIIDNDHYHCKRRVTTSQNSLNVKVVADRINEQNYTNQRHFTKNSFKTTQEHDDKSPISYFQPSNNLKNISNFVQTHESSDNVTIKTNQGTDNVRLKINKRPIRPVQVIASTSTSSLDQVVSMNDGIPLHLKSHLAITKIITTRKCNQVKENYLHHQRTENSNIDLNKTSLKFLPKVLHAELSTSSNKHSVVVQASSLVSPEYIFDDMTSYKYLHPNFYVSEKRDAHTSSMYRKNTKLKYCHPEAEETSTQFVCKSSGNHLFQSASQVSKSWEERAHATSIARQRPGRHCLRAVLDTRTVRA